MFRRCRKINRQRGDYREGEPGGEIQDRMRGSGRRGFGWRQAKLACSLVRGPGLRIFMARL
jgi:hypothetical protein